MRKHYKKDGTVFKGGVHKMPNGHIHSEKHIQSHLNEYFIMVSYLKRHKLKLELNEVNNGTKKEKRQ